MRALPNSNRVAIRDLVARLRLQRQGFSQYRQRFPVLAKAVVDRSHSGQKRCLGCGLILQSLLQTFRTRVQQFSGGDLIAAILFRIRQFEQIHQET